jgi:catechol 2,3-dioxygenase-like lactoylglutathione lyase family enzyme
MSQPSASTLGPIAGVTVTVPDLLAATTAYCAYLGYREVMRGAITPQQAGRWGYPACAGAPYAMLQPEGAGDFSLRLIESAHTGGYRAFSSFGWNAAELIVRDVDAMAVRLAGSPFEMLGPPQDLSFTDAIRAMQVRGPGGEILYLTQFKRRLPALPHPPARCDVDRVFIVIVGGPSLNELLAFYTGQFAIPQPARMESRVKAMSEVFGLSPEHRYSIAALSLRERCYIEADEMPAGAAAPETPAGQLPPGIAIVSFESAAGTGCVRGPAGELIERISR